MKTLVLGLDCAAPEILLQQPDLPNIRRLMELGMFGRLESVVPPITVPAWMCMATSRDPGSLGVYGFRNRTDYTYHPMGIVDSRSMRELTIWDQVAREGKRSIIVGVPPGFPPRKVNGIFVSGFLTPDTTKDTFTHPAEYSDVIRGIVGEYPVDVKGFRTNNKAWLKDDILSMSRRQFEVVRYLLANEPWDYFQFVEIGLDRIHHGFWKHHDPQHRFHDPDSPYRNVVRDYYRHLDEEIGRLLELLDDDTVVLLLSDHGAQRLDGGFCINEWLMREGLLSLNRRPDTVTPFDKLDVDWHNTRVWGAGGYYARIFLNVKGREPNGTIDPADFESFRDDLKTQLEATTDETGKPLGTLVFKPEDIYRDVCNIAPDLIVHFGGLFWRSIGSVGHSVVHVFENDTGPDDCNHAQFGSFVLAGSGVPCIGEIQNAHLLDMAPTLLQLGGYDVPPTMQGTALIEHGIDTPPIESTSADDAEDACRAEETIRERLAGLGYIA